jgi:hypothetical protein
MSDEIPVEIPVDPEILAWEAENIPPPEEPPPE